jgi:hypothetical protein
MNTEIPWQLFIHLSENKKLTLNEQRTRYNDYILNLEHQQNNLRIQTINTVPVAGRFINNTEPGSLLTEDMNYIVQENGFQINLT